MKPEDLWWFLLWGYPLTVLIETPILWFGLSPRHSAATRIIAGFWLTACTYPIVILVLPLIISPHWAYLTVAETLRPRRSVCSFGRRLEGGAADDGDRDSKAEGKPPEGGTPTGDTLRDMAAIIVANLASFGVGLLIDRLWPQAGA